VGSTGRAQLEGIDIGVDVEVDHAPGGLLRVIEAPIFQEPVHRLCGVGLRIRRAVERGARQP